ncbi:hypothetical protein ASD03_32510 [Ensifer sp. Root127]|nr:hypothetical protein ASD03_32510 [Ensifer sp. Root127]
MRAFILGVGGYPNAKPNRGVDQALRGVADVACAASAARLMADWLYVNRDALTPKLASIHLLVTDPEEDYDRIPYILQHLVPEKPVHRATKETVELAGRDWVASFGEGDSAFCFISGHGAVRAGDAVVFLSDLNTDDTDPWGAHFNITEVATAFKAKSILNAAYFFVDACQEFSSEFVLSNSHGARFIRPLHPFKLHEAREKVLLISAAAEGLRAFEGDWPQDRRQQAAKTITIGRFTQVLIDALDGASARFDNGKWIIDTGRWKLQSDLRFLYGRRQSWSERFEPVTLIDQNNFFPLVISPNPRIPIFVLTDPERLMASYRLHVHDDKRARLLSCPLGRSTTWMFEISPSTRPHYLIAENDMWRHETEFAPTGPIFNQRISVS